MTQISARLFVDLVGAPFVAGGRGPSSYDCLGLAMEFQRRRGLAVPAYLSSAEELHRQMGEGGALDECLRLDAPEAGCLVLMRNDSLGERHLGCMIDSARMIHASEHVGCVVIERLESSFWVRRVLGYYRVEGRC